MQRALEEEGFFFESTSEMIESFKLPRSERGRVKVSEAAYYRDLEAQEKAWFDDNEVALGQWETLRDRMLPKDFLMRDEAEQAEILTGLQDATARLLLEHPGLTQTVSVKDMTGARHTNVIPSERFSQYAQNSNRDRLGLLSGRVPTAAEQMTPEPLLGPVRPTPEAMIRKLKLVRDAIGIQAEERQELKLVDLANGLQAATERMARIQNLTPENAADMVDFMTKPPSEGGVKGVGPSTANLVKSIIRAPVTNPDEALKFANDWRMAQGKELIEPIKAPEKPPVFDIEAPENAEMKAEILTEMESVRSRLDAPHGEAAQFAEQSVLRYQNYPLPADSTARANQLARLRSIFLSSYQNVKAPETALGAKARKLLNYAMGAASMRPLVSYNAERIGDPTLLENYTRLVDSAAEAKYDIGVIRYKSLFDEAKVPEWELAMRPNIEDALITLVGTDPRSVGAEDSIRTAEQSLVDYTRPSEAWKLIERLSKLERRDPKTAEITKRIKDMEIPFSDKKNRYRKLFDNVVAELRGPTAVNVRMNQLHKWRRNWEKHGSAIMDLQARLAQPDLDTRERQQLRSKLQKRLSIMELASPIMTDEAGEPRSVPLETMKIASDILDTQGTQALRVHLAKSTAGTRRHYWMSEDSPDEGSFLPNVEANELVFAEGGGRASTVGVPGETRPRFTATKLARGNFSGRLFQQMMRMELRARTNPHSEAILRTLFKNRNDIDDSHFKELEQMVFNAAGRGQFAGPAEIPRAVTRWFWKFYPWDISRLIWYSSRNRFQNFAIGPSQVGAANFWKSANRISALKRNPATLHRQAHDEVFERLISERQNLVREFMMQREAAERGKIPSGEVAKIASKLEDIGSQLLPWSDTANRSEMWSISYDTAERHLTSFLKGEITQGDMEKKILMDNMPPAESILLAKLFDQGRQAGGQRLDYEPFVRHYAQLKNLFTNFAYRNIGRSGWEQWIWTRPVMGLIVWPRGAFEAFYRSGLRPIVDGYKTNNPTKVWQGMNTVGLFLFQMYLAGVGHGLLFGMKRRGEDASPAYHPLNFTGYSPQGIGLQFIMDSFSFLGRLLSADQEDLADIMEGYAETASHMLPALPTIARAYEAANDVQKAGNVRWLIERARFGTDFAEPADREEPQLIPDDWFEKLPDEFVDVVNWAEKARHILVGTETPTFTELWGAPAHLPFTEIGREE